MLKHKPIITAIALSISNFTHADTTTGLVAYYPFNGNANDASGNGNNGTVYGGTVLTSDRFGIANSAYSFNRTDAYIDINLPTLNTTAGSQVTVSFWMNWDGIEGSTGVMPFGFNNYDVYFSGGYFGFNTNNGDIWGISSSGLANHWMFVTTIFNNGDITLSSLYTDGSNRTLAQMLSSPYVRNVSTNARIGAWPTDTDYRFGGKIDDVRIYNRALTATEVQQLYQADLTIPTSTTLISSANPANQTQNLTFTATVAATQSIPSGNLTFKVDGAAKQTSSLNSSGKSTYATAALATGAHTIRAEYAGTSTYKPSSAQLTQTVIARPDFVITGLSLTPATPQINQAFSVRVAVKNQNTVVGNGGTLSLWTDKAAVATCVPAGGPSTSSGTASVGTVASGASKVFTFNGVTVSSAGAKTLRAFVDSTCAALETSETNNQAAKSYTVAAGTTDLSVASIILTPTAPALGTTFSVQAVVKNLGTAPVSSSFVDLWTNQATPQPCGAAGDEWQVVGALAAGASQTVTFSDLPAGTAGAKTVRVLADSWCETLDVNRNNNQLARSYSISERPDFVVNSLTLIPASPTANSTFSVVAVVSNQNNLAANAGNLVLWVNQPTMQNCEAAGDKSVLVGVLAAHEIKTLTIGGLSAGTAGARQLRAFIDAGCVMLEANEANNQMVQSYTVQ